jgi:alpha-1,3-glucosyltransferase
MFLDLIPSLPIWILASCIKILLFPTYKSTDFEVHRHWLALTSKLSRGEWYFDTTSEWTLDYPPFFALFEYVLGKFGFPPTELLTYPPIPNSTLPSTNHMGISATLSPSSIAWHRSTVIITEAISLGLAVSCFARTWPIQTRTTAESCLSHDKLTLAIALVALDPNLLVLDHVHFQYNGFLLGISLLSIAALRGERNFLGALIFACLLNFKHIFLYAAPLYTIYLFKRHCMGWPNRLPIIQSVIHLIGLGMIVISVFVTSFCLVGCFIVPYRDPLLVLKQILSRLFPVEARGLLHAYWAPNAWALYAATDVGLGFLAKHYGWNELFGNFVQVTSNVGISSSSSSNNNNNSNYSSTRGLVQGSIQFTILPNIPPIITILFTIFSMSGFLYFIWKHPHPTLFLHAYACIVLCSFIFGYHVHEKALAMVSVPLALVSLDSALDARLYLMLTWITQVALAPLLYQSNLGLFKLTLVFCHAFWAVNALDAFHVKQRKESRISFRGGLPAAFSWLDRIYLCGLALVFAIYETGAIRWLSKHGNRYEFLPLILISVYTGLGVLQCWYDCTMLLIRRARSLKSDERSPMITSQQPTHHHQPIVNVPGGMLNDDSLKGS